MAERKTFLFPWLILITGCIEKLETMEDHQRQQEAIEHYIKAYNAIDIGGMLRNLHENVCFENIANGQVNFKSRGIEAFRNQAEKAKKLFQRREQKITGIKYGGDTIEVQIDYTAELSQDLPNGLKAGDTIHLSGKSVFVFEGDKIIYLKDES